MPYRDPEKRREAARLSMQKRRSGNKGLTQNVNPKVNPVNPVNPLTPVNPVKPSYLLSYSRNKYQFVLYHIDQDGKKNIIKSCTKGEKIVLGSVEIELTWGPDLESIKEAVK